MECGTVQFGTDLLTLRRCVIPPFFYLKKEAAGSSAMLMHSRIHDVTLKSGNFNSHTVTTLLPPLHLSAFLCYSYVMYCGTREGQCVGIISL